MGLSCFNMVRNLVYKAIAILKSSTPSINTQGFHVDIDGPTLQSNFVDREVQWLRAVILFYFYNSCIVVFQ